MKFPEQALVGSDEEVAPASPDGPTSAEVFAEDDTPPAPEFPIPTPGEPLGFRQKELARLIALGKTNTEIAEKMGMNPSRVSAMRRFPEIHDEAERYRDRLFEGDISERLKELNAGAFGQLEKLLRDPKTKDNVKLQAALWILEKTTGKPMQQIDVKHSSLDSFYKLVSEMQTRGEVLDVTPGPAKRDALPAPDHDPGAENPERSEGFDAARWVADET